MEVLKPRWTDEEIKFLRDHCATMKSPTPDIMREAADTIDKKKGEFYKPINEVREAVSDIQ